MTNQSQASLSDQLKELGKLAINAGLYDADDYLVSIKRQVVALESALEAAESEKNSLLVSLGRQVERAESAEDTVKNLEASRHGMGIRIEAVESALVKDRGTIDDMTEHQIVLNDEIERLRKAQARRDPCDECEALSSNECDFCPVLHGIGPLATLMEDNKRLFNEVEYRRSQLEPWMQKAELFEVQMHNMAESMAVLQSAPVFRLDHEASVQVLAYLRDRDEGRVERALREFARIDGWAWQDFTASSEFAKNKNLVERLLAVADEVKP